MENLKNSPWNRKEWLVPAIYYDNEDDNNILEITLMDQQKCIGQKVEIFAQIDPINRNWSISHLLSIQSCVWQLMEVNNVDTFLLAKHISKSLARLHRNKNYDEDHEQQQQIQENKNPRKTQECTDTTICTNQTTQPTDEEKTSNQQINQTKQHPHHCLEEHIQDRQRQHHCQQQQILQRKKKTFKRLTTHRQKATKNIPVVTKQ